MNFITCTSENNRSLLGVLELSFFLETHPLREKCPNTKLFPVRIFLYSDEYGEIRSISPYSVRIQENTDQK